MFILFTLLGGKVALSISRKNLNLFCYSEASSERAVISSELNMAEEEEEVQVPEDKDSNIELGSLQGSEEEKSDGERNV